MTELSLEELLDEFAPAGHEDHATASVDEAIPLPACEPRKRRHSFRLAENLPLCPCPDCLRQRPGRAALVAAKKAGK